MFMGDVGALALGAALGTLALLTKQEAVLLVRAASSSPRHCPSSCRCLIQAAAQAHLSHGADHHHFELQVGPSRRSSCAFGSSDHLRVARVGDVETR